MSKFDDPMYNKGYDDGFADAANNPDKPDMREKVEEYIQTLDAEIDRCSLWLEENMNGYACAVSSMESRIQTLAQVKNDLQSRLDELI